MGPLARESVFVSYVVGSCRGRGCHDGREVVRACGLVVWVVGVAWREHGNTGLDGSKEDAVFVTRGENMLMVRMTLARGMNTG